MMLNFREATEADYPKLQEMHAQQGLPYPLPPLGDRSMVVKLLAERNGDIAYAALLRFTSEAYLLGTSEGTPEERWQILQAMNAQLMQRAWKAGFSDVNAYLPPTMEKSFGRRLVSLGWEKSWPAYSIWPGVQLGQR